MADDKDNNTELEEQVIQDSVEDEVENGPDYSEASEDESEEKQDDSLSETDSLMAQLEEAQQQVVDAKDQALRHQAEMQNIRRRAERDVESAHKFALERFSNELLPTVDNLERALDAVDLEQESVQALVEGIELTRKHFLDVMKKFNIEQIDPLGEPFDPQFHQAMSMIDAPDAEPNSVTAVMQKGFTLSGRLLRPAMVMVAKPAPKIDEQA